MQTLSLQVLTRRMSPRGMLAVALGVVALGGIAHVGDRGAWLTVLPLLAMVPVRAPVATRRRAALLGSLALLLSALGAAPAAAVVPATLGGMLLGSAPRAGSSVAAGVVTVAWIVQAWTSLPVWPVALIAPLCLLLPSRATAPPGTAPSPGMLIGSGIAVLLLPATDPLLPLLRAAVGGLLLASLVPDAPPAAPPPPRPSVPDPPPAAPPPPRPSVPDPPPAAPPPPRPSVPDPLDLVLRGIVHDLRQTRRTVAAGASAAAALALIDAIVERLMRYLRDRQVTCSTPINVRAVLHAAATAWTPVARDHGIVIRAPSGDAEEPLWVIGDATAIRRILDNLITNAIAATPPGGSIALSSAVHHDMAHLTVADTGCGIPHAMRDLIVRPRVSTRPDGEGMGLTIVCDLAAAMRGDVVIADRPGGGTCVTVRLPVARPHRDSSTSSEPALPAAQRRW